MGGKESVKSDSDREMVGLVLSWDLNTLYLVVGSCYKWGALTAKARQMRMAFLLQFRNQGMF